MTEFIMDGKASIRLSQFVLSRCSDIGYALFRTLLRKGEIRIDDKKIYVDCSVSPGQRVKIFYKKLPEPTIRPIYDDESIAVFFKPKKTITNGQDSFEEKIRRMYGENYTACHRLDTNTDGLILFSKSTAVFEAVKTLFREKNVEKHYGAIVCGKVEKPTVLRDYLVKDSDSASVKIYEEKQPTSVEIVTELTPLESNGDLTFLSVRPITGKTHQIRAHLAFHGIPILGDSKYGKEAINRAYRAKSQYLRAYKIILHVANGILKYLDGAEFIADNLSFSDLIPNA